MSPPQGMVRIFEPADAIELALARAALQAEAIPFFVENEHYFFVGGGGFWSQNDTRVWVQVPESEAERGRAAIDDATGEGPAPGDDVGDGR